MSSILQLSLDRFATPVGQMMIAVDMDGSLRAAYFTEDEEILRRQLRLHYGDAGFTLQPESNPSGVTAQLKKYFAGDLCVIESMSVKTGGTPFQKDVWRALREIPCGTTTSYGELAKRIGRAAAVRAVGAANGANPVSVVVPCHRVIGSNGSLTGYGGGIDRKQWLLHHERLLLF